MPSPKVKIRKN